MNEQKKAYYSFINMKRCVGKNGNGYVGITLEAKVVKPEMRTTETGKEVLSFSVPISNRAKYIESMCGMSPYAGDDGTVWARVTAWEDLAGRLNKFLTKCPNCVLLITGAIKVEQSAGNDGNTYTNTVITMDDFTLLRALNRNGDNKNAGNESRNNSYQPAGNSGNSYGNSYDSGFGGGFANIDEVDSDGELPF